MAEHISSEITALKMYKDDIITFNRKYCMYMRKLLNI